MDGCPLTPRELATLELLSEGLVYKQIAIRHGVSQSTVRTHLHKIYTKIGAVDRAHAVLIAERAGWIRPEIGPVMSPSHQLLFDVREALRRIERRLPLNRHERARLARFEHEVRNHPDRGPEADRMLDDLGAILTYVGRYGQIPSRERPRRPTDG